MQHTQKTIATTDTITCNHNGLSTTCFFTNTNKLHKKIERWNGITTEFTYQFDDKGHLSKAFRNATLMEQYQYNQIGQRVLQNRATCTSAYTTKDLLTYDASSKLVKAGDITYLYNKYGALSQRCDNQGITKFSYGTDTMLDKVILPSGAIIHYEFGSNTSIKTSAKTSIKNPVKNSINPARRFKNNQLTTEYEWLDSFTLAACKDYELQLEYSFIYNDFNVLNTIHIAQCLKNRVSIPAKQTGWRIS